MLSLRCTSMDTRTALGRRGEDLAARRYEDDGYTVVCRNFRCSAGEIDLVVQRGETLVFSEVKTRATDFFGDPSEAVTPAKQARLRRLAAIWLGENRRRAMEVRFDVVSIVIDRSGARVSRYEDAF